MDISAPNEFFRAAVRRALQRPVFSVRCTCLSTVQWVHSQLRAAGRNPVSTFRDGAWVITAEGRRS